MYLRFEGDSGFKSWNPEFKGDKEEQIEYVLSNGQLDKYPASWAIDLNRAIEFLYFFFETGNRDPNIQWKKE